MVAIGIQILIANKKSPREFLRQIQPFRSMSVGALAGVAINVHINIGGSSQNTD